MERTLESFSWTALWWDGRTARTGGNGESDGLQAEPVLQEGLLAYASEHADMYRGLRTVFEMRWMEVRKAAQLFLARKSVLDETEDLHVSGVVGS